MLDHSIEQAREEEICSREDTPTEQREEVLTYCRGQPVVLADRSDWDDWPFDLLEWEGKRETWGDRSLIEAWVSVLTYRPMLFRHRFPHDSTRDSTESWLPAFAALHTAMLQS